MSEQRVAVVTGASSGIGSAIAEGLADAGFRVFGASRRVPEQQTGRVQHLAIDVCDDDSARQGVGAILREAGRIDVLVNNAGYLLAGAVEEVPLADAAAQFETNYFGVVRMTVAVLPGMRERRSGHIITISSLAGLVPVPFWGHYNASKFAVEGLMETLRHEVRPYDIRVAMVEPGAIRTALYDNVPTSGMAAYAAPRGRSFGAMAAFERKAPGPDLVARKVVALAKDPHPRLRNTVTKEARQFTLLKWALPSGAFEAGVRSGFKLAGKDDTPVPVNTAVPVTSASTKESAAP
ncbi:MAG TPA: SDR family NAD(P)-dependent oxidoreductase [Actinomycetes bacterium]